MTPFMPGWSNGMWGRASSDTGWHECVAHASRCSSPSIAATQLGLESVVALLLHAGVNVNTQWRGMCAIHHAIQAQNVGMAETLLSGDPTCPHSNTWSAGGAVGSADGYVPSCGSSCTTTGRYTLWRNSDEPGRLQLQQLCKHSARPSCSCCSRPSLGPTCGVSQQPNTTASSVAQWKMAAHQWSACCWMGAWM